MFIQKSTTNRNLLTIFVVLITIFLIVSCAQPPTEEPEPPAVVETEVEVTEPEGTMVDYTDVFSTYPKELPSHCDPEKVQAAYEWAQQNWTLPVEENEGYVPYVRPAKERYKIGVIQGLVGIPAQARGDVSVQNAADLMCVDLVWCDSKFEAEAAINCAESMVEQNVDGVVNENWYDPAMAAMADIMEGIPATVWEVPMPNSPFFGTEQCTDGRLKGEYFVNYTKENYQGDIADIWIVPNVNYDVGEAMQRITCAIDVIKEAFPEIPEDHYVELPGGSFTDQAYEAMTTWLTAHPDAQWIFGTGINDNAGAGASTACDTAGFVDRCVILGSNGEAQAWNELDKPNDESSFKATVDHTQIDDGRYMLPIVIDQIEGIQVPENVFQYIFLLDRDNMAEHSATRPID